MVSKEKWKEKPECVRLWNGQYACWFAVNVWKSESSQCQSVCLCTQRVLWFISDKGNMMCQFVSLTPSSSLSSLIDRRGLGGGGPVYGGVEGRGWLCPAQGRASLCGQRVMRWSGSSAGHSANLPPLLPSTDKAINPGLLWASAALNLWAFTAYCSVGLTLPTGGSMLCTYRVGKEFKLRVKFVEEFSFRWGNWISMSWRWHRQVQMTTKRHMHYIIVTHII